MKTLNYLSFTIIFVALILLCLSMVQKNLNMLMASEVIFFLGGILMFLTNKVLYKSK